MHSIYDVCRSDGWLCADMHAKLTQAPRVDSQLAAEVSVVEHFLKSFLTQILVISYPSIGILQC